MKSILFCTLLFTPFVNAEIIEPGTPITTEYDLSKEVAFSEERELAQVVINGASTVSDCYNFEGLFEDPEDLFSAMREQFGPQNESDNSSGGSSSSSNSGKSSN